MTFRDDKLQDGWIASATAATAGGVSATKAAATGVTYTVTGIQCSSDAAALVTIQTPSGTTVWRQRFTAAFTMNVPFAQGTINTATGDAVLVNVSASTNNVEANIQGYSF